MGASLRIAARNPLSENCPSQIGPASSQAVFEFEEQERLELRRAGGGTGRKEEGICRIRPTPQKTNPAETIRPTRNPSSIDMKNLTISLTLLTALAIFLAPASQSTMEATAYKIDSAHSSIHFRIAHMGISNTWGRFNKMSGKLSFAPGGEGQLAAIGRPGESADGLEGLGEEKSCLGILEGRQGQGPGFGLGRI
jgi:hypothetical protein